MTESMNSDLLENDLLRGWRHIGALDVPHSKYYTFHVYEWSDSRNEDGKGIQVVLDGKANSKLINEANILKDEWCANFDLAGTIKNLMHRIADLGPVLERVHLCTGRKIKKPAPYFSIGLKSVEPWPYDGQPDVYVSITYEPGTRADDLERRIRGLLEQSHRDNRQKLARIAARPRMVERIGAIIVLRTLEKTAGGAGVTLQEFRQALDLAPPRVSISSISIESVSSKDERRLEMESTRREIAPGIAIIRRGNLVVNAGLPGIAIIDRIVRIRKTMLPEPVCTDMKMVPLEQVVNIPLLAGFDLKVESLWNVGSQSPKSYHPPRVTARIASDPVNIDNDAALLEIMSRSAAMRRGS